MRLQCACGNSTETMCFFTQPAQHGVCTSCGDLRLLQLETGQTVQRFVCDRCWGQFREKRRSGGYNPLTPFGDPNPVRKS